LNYKWFSGADLLSNENPATMYLAKSKNIFTLMGTDAYQCSNTTNTNVNAEDCCGIMVPSAFSPNGDGLNDKFGAISLGHPYNFRMSVFDRWGKLVFHSLDINQQWDGSYNGQPAALATYFYLIQSDCANGMPFVKKGDVTLVR
jgi:gliding motility-associated-like protein